MKIQKLLFTTLLLAFSINAYSGSTDDMWESFKTHDVAKLKSAIENGADVNALDKNGSPALNSAAIWADMTQMLVDAKADVNNAGKADMTPLMIAAMMSMNESMEILLNAGADPNYKMKNGMSILHYATWRSNCSPCVQLLIDKGADVNAKDNNGETPITIMMTASTAKSRAETVVYTVNGYKAGGVTVMPEKYMNPKESDWDDPDKIIEILVKAGADVNASNVVGTTPLITAAFFNKAQLIQMLIDAGADINMMDKAGITPLMYAAERGSKDAIELLLDKGVDVNQTFKWVDQKLNADVKDFTVLTFAVMKNNYELAKALLARGANCKIPVHGMFPVEADVVGIVGKTGKTTYCVFKVKEKNPLYFAIETGNIEMVKLLVESCDYSTIKASWKNFEIKAITKACYGGPEGKYVRAQIYAQKLGHKEIAAYLKDKGL